jgi:hypothetical protein
MNPLHPDSPIRNTLKRLTLAISPVILACCLASQAHAQWSYSAWTNDADSGITNASPYTVAVNFGGTATTVNGVAFQASALTGLNFSIGGGVAYSSGTPNITGDSLALASNFIYDGNPRTVTLTNLTPGATYETSLFAYGHDAAPTSRSQTFASGSDSLVLDQNIYGQNQGIRITYTFVADSSGSKELTITPVAGDSFHMSALANRRVSPSSWRYNAWSTINWTDDSSLSFITSSNVTHSGDFVTPWVPAATINGHTFGAISTGGGPGSSFTTPYSGSNFTIGSSEAMLTYSYTADVGAWGTASSKLSYDLMVFNGGSGTTTYNLTGLSPHTNYEFYLFSPDWTDTGRTGVLDGSDDVANTFAIDQSVGSGHEIIKYAYNTGASTTFTMSVSSTNGLHQYAFVNVIPEPSASSYSTWASANGITGQPASGDFDNDGLTNLVEYALGLSPTVSSVPPGTFDGSLLSFNKGAEAKANGDVTYEIEQSTTLGGWTVVVPNAPASATISYTLPSGQPKEFARLKITQIP